MSIKYQSKNTQTAFVEDVRKKKWNSAIIYLSLLVVVAIVSGCSGTASTNTIQAEPISIAAKMSDDGTAYIPLMDGSCFTVNDEVKEAVLTKDRKHVVVNLLDGGLYVADPENELSTKIAEDCDNISAIRNDGFFYTDLDGIVYRVLFSDFSTLKIGNDVAYIVAENNTSVLYATDEGGIYTLKNTENDSSKVGTYSNSIEVEAISDNGEISVWVTEEDEVQTIVLNDGDDRVTLGEVDYKYNYTYLTFSEDQGVLVITNAYSDSLWIKYPEKEPIKAKLSAEPADSTIYTSTGALVDTQSGEVTSLYVSTEADKGNNIYNISLDGEREKVLFKVDEYVIANGKIIYTDTEKTLYFATLEGANISEEIRIASGVDTFEISHNGQYVYYMKDCENDMGTLYCYKIGESEPLKIASEVACWSNWMYNHYSLDGASVFFYKDMEDIGDTYSEQGSLMLWKYGDESPTKIATEVMEYSVSSYFKSGEVNPKSFMFAKYISDDSDENIYTNWMYHNGTEATKVATDIVW